MACFGILKFWMMTKRINLISGPRNISTALMYSFANRPDTKVVDEPMYGYYLQHTGITYHPGTKESLAALPHDMYTIKRDLIFQEVDQPIYFIKGMAHHYVDVEDLDFLSELTNVFLIRDPYQLIASFAQVVEKPSMLDIALQMEWEIFDQLKKRGEDPIVIDSNVILSNPEAELGKLCARLDIPFEKSMLSWSAGPIPEDGPWAKYWYHNVWKSRGFKKQKTSTRKLPKRLMPLYERSLPYYEQLKAFR